MTRQTRPRKKSEPREPKREQRRRRNFKPYCTKEFREFSNQHKGILEEIWKLAAEFQGKRGFGLREEVSRTVRLKNWNFTTIKISPTSTGSYRGERNVGAFMVQAEGRTFFVKLFNTPGDVEQITAANN